MKKLFCLALCFLVAAPALAQDASAPPSPQKIALAQRVLQSMDGMEGSVLYTAQRLVLLRGLKPPFSAQRAVYFNAATIALGAHMAEIKKRQEERAEIYASLHTEEDLAAILAYRNTPLGQSIRQKENAQLSAQLLAGTSSSAPLPLTPEEAAAYKAFNDGPGKAMERRTGQAIMAANLASAPLMASLFRMTEQEFCTMTANCPKELLDSLKEPR